MKYSMHAHTPESLQLAVAKAFEAALPAANEHGVGLVVVVIDAAERVHYQTNLGPTLTAGMLSRCAGLYDAKPATPHGVPVALTPGLVVGGGISTHGPGGGVAGGSTTAVGGNASGGGAYPPGCGPVSQADRDSLYRSGIMLGAGFYSVVSDPPGLGGEGRTGSSAGGMSTNAPERRPLDPAEAAAQRSGAEAAAYYGDPPPTELERKD